MNQSTKIIDAWIEYVYSEWLYRWEYAPLRPSVSRLIYKMRNAVNNPKTFNDAWKLVDEIERLHNLVQDNTRTYSKESPQLLLECGIAAYKMGNSREAIRFLNGALSSYVDAHENAVARWLLGCIYWHLDNEVNAISAWYQSLSNFRELENRTLKNADRTAWYHEKVKEMSEAIKQTVEKNVPPPNLAKSKTTYQDDILAQKVFVSYSRLDEIQAQRIYNALVQQGYLPWLDKISLLPGQVWELEIKKAIKESNFIVLVLSQNAMSKQGYFHKEIRFALEVFETIPPGNIFLIPARLDDCFVPETLQKLHWVDMFPDWDEGFKKISRSLADQIEKMHPLESLPVIGEIPAGTPLNVVPTLYYMETNQVSLDGKDFKIVSLLPGEKVVNLPMGQRFYVLRVIGDSMNRATPEPIENGDYVIMREQRTAENEDIVAAEIVSGDGKDDRATLKRFKRIDGKLFLIPESTNPMFSERIDPTKFFTKFDEEFYVRGVALAVLKPLPKEKS